MTTKCARHALPSLSPTLRTQVRVARWEESLLGLAAGLLGGADRRLVGLGASSSTSELLHEPGGGLEGAGEGALGDLVPDVELGLVRLEDSLDGGDGLDEELGLARLTRGRSEREIERLGG